LILLFDLRTGLQTQKLGLKSGAVTMLGLNGEWIAAVTRDNQLHLLRICDDEDGKIRKQHPSIPSTASKDPPGAAESGHVLCVAVRDRHGEEAASVFVGRRDGSFAVINMETGTCIQTGSLVSHQQPGEAVGCVSMVVTSDRVVAISIERHRRAESHAQAKALTVEQWSYPDLCYLGYSALHSREAHLLAMPHLPPSVEPDTASLHGPMSMAVCGKHVVVSGIVPGAWLTLVPTPSSSGDSSVQGDPACLIQHLMIESPELLRREASEGREGGTMRLTVLGGDDDVTICQELHCKGELHGGRGLLRVVHNETGRVLLEAQASSVDTMLQWGSTVLLRHECKNILSRKSSKQKNAVARQPRKREKEARETVLPDASEANANEDEQPRGKKKHAKGGHKKRRDEERERRQREGKSREMRPGGQKTHGMGLGH